MLVRRCACLLALSLPLVFLASACSPTDPSQLGRTIIVRGAVTESTTGQPIAGVKVTLVSDATFPSRVTDAGGLFLFDGVQRLDNLLVQFQKDGYLTQTITVHISNGLDQSLDAGTLFFDGYDASVQLTQAYFVPIAGIVYSGPTPAKGAKVSLWNGGGQGFATVADDNGRFAFANVPTGTWEVVIAPWDRDGDGFSDTQFFGQNIQVAPQGAPNLGNLVFNLADVQRALVASSFVNLNHAYPIDANALLNGVSGVLQAVGGSIFLHFGAEVDPNLTSFELVAIEPNGRVSPPIGLTVAWDHAAVATLTPATSLVASSDSTIGYELRVRALRFTDGTVGILPSGTVFGKIDFSVQALPAALASPTPSLSMLTKSPATQTAASGAVDDSTIWLLDTNGDLPFDTVQSANFSANSGLQLQWAPVAQAVTYHVYARNTVSRSNNEQGNLDWRELNATFLTAIDPSSNTPVAVNVNPWGTLGVVPSQNAPWRYGNHVQFAITTEDALGFRSNIDTSKLLDTKDDFGGFLTGIAVDPGGQPGLFAATTERGAQFNRTFKLTFSEPMNAASIPTLTSTGGALTAKKVVVSGFGGTTPDSSVSDSNTAFVTLQLEAHSPCTELLLARAAGDVLLPVRDASLFPVSTTAKLLFLDGGSGGFLGESTGVTASDTTANVVTLTTALVPTLANNSLVCALGDATATAFVSTATTSMVVNDAKAFFVGQTIMVYEPQVSGAGQIADVRTISGIDTPTNTLVLNSALTAGHTTASIVFAFTAGGETALRSSTVVALQKDVIGAADSDLFVAGPISGVAIGDLVLIDLDGDAKTTKDQFQVKVKQLKFAPAAPPTVYSFTADVPTGVTILHGRATVRALGDSFTVGGTRDTSASAAKPLDTHRDQFTIDGTLF
ncbi:MAG: carboxypeptidase regulatory-like domain-containing protein [Deltaproteobacteria bacterium]|nr:carboxypeptidase regulatory-like domain-containing protein [Deltaproteobacteria bacterium]